MALQLLYRKLISCDREMFCNGIYGFFFGLFIRLLPRPSSHRFAGLSVQPGRAQHSGKNSL